MLRERLDRLADEYNKLQEYTVLEKQLYAEERAGDKDVRFQVLKYSNGESNCNVSFQSGQ